MNTPASSVCLWLSVHKSGKVFIALLADLFNKVALLTAGMQNCVSPPRSVKLFILLSQLKPCIMLCQFRKNEKLLFDLQRCINTKSKKSSFMI